MYRKKCEVRRWFIFVTVVVVAAIIGFGCSSRFVTTGSILLSSLSSSSSSSSSLTSGHYRSASSIKSPSKIRRFLLLPIITTASKALLPTKRYYCWSSSSSYLASLSTFAASSSTCNSCTAPTTTRTIASTITTTKQFTTTVDSIIMSTATTPTELYKPIVICGPSGVGKGTLIDMIMKYFTAPNDDAVAPFGFSVSHTTRLPRDGEIHGKHYYYTTVPEMKNDISHNKFIEYAEVHGKYYGTSFEAVELVQKNGQICILDIDIQGVQKVKLSSLDVYYIFISPPSHEELEKRLRGRATETEDAITTRLANAKLELQYGETPGNFDRIFINRDLNICFDEIKKQLLVWYPHLNQYSKVQEEEEK